MTDQVQIAAGDKPAAAAATTAEPKPGTPEYDAAMAAKGRAMREGADPAEAAKPTRPDNVPEKFWDADKGVVNTEALLKSYTELESKGGKKPDEKPAEKVEEKKPDAAAQSEEDKTKGIVEKAGLKWDDVVTKITSKGELDAADYEAIEKAGIPKSIAEDYVRLSVQRAKAEQDSATNYIGGQEETDKLLGWAATSLTPAEKESYNKLLAGNDWKIAVDGLKAKRAASAKTNGEPDLKGAESSGATGTLGYKDRAEQRADMANPLYFEQSPKGATYRAEVEKKTAAAVWMRKSA